jgi:hypothetical protein
MEGNYKTMQTENYALKEYVIHLQSRLRHRMSTCHIRMRRRQMRRGLPPSGRTAHLGRL